MALPRRDRDVKINKRMKEIVPSDVLKNYLVGRTQSYDDFLTLRRTLSYQYGVLQCLNFVLSVPTELGKFMLDLRTGGVSVYALNFNYSPEKLSPFAIRFSRNFQELFGRTYINSGVLPAFLATADALTNHKYPSSNSDSTSGPTSRCSTTSWPGCASPPRATTSSRDWPTSAGTTSAG